MVRVNLGLMIAAYLPAGILMAVRDVELGMGLGMVALGLLQLSAQATFE
jgi:hypothetical protein